MLNRKNKGFTLIELLVVIAIIGILASVVLASLNTARAKGANAAVKENLDNMRAQAEIQYSIDNSYSNVCTSNAQITNMLTAAAAAGGGVLYASTADCNANATQWAAYAVLKVAEGTYTTWCVDSTGASRGQTAANVTVLGTTGVACQ